MGVKRQLCFPTGVGMWGAFMVMNHKDLTMARLIKENRIQYGKELCKAYNEWAISVAPQSDRVRFVLPAFGDTPAELMADAKYLINSYQLRRRADLRQVAGPFRPRSFLEKMMTDNNIAVRPHVGPDQPYESSDG